MENGSEIYLIRHGQTDWNAQGRLQGHTDIPLNREGILQAQALRDRLQNIKFRSAFSSDLTRALQTAEIVLNPYEIPIKQTPNLRERSLGSWEGRLKKELPSIKFSSQQEYLNYKCCPKMESLTETYQRLKEFIQKIPAATLQGPILLSCHGGILSSVMYHLEYFPEIRWSIENCAWIKLQATNQSLEIISFEGIIAQNVW
ncbi:MAG: putative phosphoglycerate mutase [Chlamydiales bacterium]|jgi:broad specificity phosphatase PhoE|nr:putative phosphoglycerate mutase [Chlamydiales bacterium]